jgi:hypothetical protein
LKHLHKVAAPKGRGFANKQWFAKEVNVLCHLRLFVYVIKKVAYVFGLRNEPVLSYLNHSHPIRIVVNTIDSGIWKEFEKIVTRTSVYYPRNIQVMLRDYLNYSTTDADRRAQLLEKIPTVSKLGYVTKVLSGARGYFKVTVDRIKFLCKQRKAPRFRAEGEEPFHCKSWEQDIPFVLSPSFTTSSTEISQMVLVFTTASMLANAVDALYISVDGTYNLSLQKTVGVVVGALDPSKKLHPIAIAIVTCENAAAYEQIITQIDDACYGLFFRHLRPLILQADGAWEISNGVNAALRKKGIPEPSRASCFYHVIAKIRSNLLGAHQIGKAMWGRIAADISVLKESFTRKDFEKGVSLFMLKYEAIAAGLEANPDVPLAAADDVSDCDSELNFEEVSKLIDAKKLTMEEAGGLRDQGVISEAVLEKLSAERSRNEPHSPVTRRSRDEPPAPVAVRKGLRTALEYLRSEYLSMTHFRANFYAGSVPESGRWCSRTNCATEGFNNSLKTILNHNRIPSLYALIRSLTHAPMMNISMESRSEPMDRPPTPTKAMLWNASKLHDHFGEVAMCVNNHFDFNQEDFYTGKTVYIFKNEGTEFDLEVLKAYIFSEQTSWTQFSDNKKDYCIVMWKTVPDFRVSPPDGVLCTCPVYNASNVCAHAVCVSLVLGDFRSDSIIRAPLQRRAHTLNQNIIGNRSKYGILGPVVPSRVNGRTARKKRMANDASRKGSLR